MVAKADFSGDKDAVWWLGYSCLLLRMGGQYILYDPALGKRASPLPFAGPLRKTPLAAIIAELPNIDWVLYSHNHYDHLDRGTLRRLLKRFPALRVAAPAFLLSRRQRPYPAVGGNWPMPEAV